MTPTRPASMIEVAVTIRQVRDKSIAVADGTETERPDRTTGELRKVEKWFFLPRSQVTIEGLADEDIGANLEGTTVTMHVPEWLAKEKGLI